MRPLKYPAIIPNPPPKRKPIRGDRTPTANDTLAPWTSRDKTSRPIASITATMPQTDGDKPPSAPRVATERMKTPQERLFAELEKYDDLLARNAIAQETWARAVADANQRAEAAMKTTTSTMTEETTKAASTMSSMMQEGFFAVMQGDFDGLASSRRQLLEVHSAKIRAARSRAPVYGARLRRSDSQRRGLIRWSAESEKPRGAPLLGRKAHDVTLGRQVVE